jgi:hypothetical protein
MISLHVGLELRRINWLLFNGIGLDAGDGNEIAQ